MSLIKVSARSRTASVAGAIAGVFRESGFEEVQIGAQERTAVRILVQSRAEIGQLEPEATLAE
jgi:stage V sporulation protein SpoVS